MSSLRGASFDTVIVASLSITYCGILSAICEFFRVCRRGGHLLIIDEPFSPPTAEDVTLLSGADADVLFDSVRLGDVRSRLGVDAGQRPDDGTSSDMQGLEQNRPYVQARSRRPGVAPGRQVPRLVASGLPCRSAPSYVFLQIWIGLPRSRGSTDSGGIVRFRHGPNPHLDENPLERIVSPGNVSLVARKTIPTRVFQDRTGLRQVPFDVVRQLAGLPGAPSW